MLFLYNSICSSRIWESKVFANDRIYSENAAGAPRNAANIAK